MVIGITGDSESPVSKPSARSWPFMYFVRLAITFVAGLYERGAAKLYVSRGTGFWGPPMRLFAPAEIGELILRCEGAD